MCGIAGKLNFDAERPVRRELLQRMTDAIAHRGPDGEGHYVLGPVGLGHRRLSIIDLDTGGQPLSNEDGSVWVVFNGEIYNYRDLRRQLLARGHAFRTHSDTEVIVHLWEEHGADCVSHLRGMFAFALWDEGRRALFLARDRVGIKPLYYCHTPRALVFGSEIKALLQDREVPREIDPRAIDRFLSYLYLPGPGTMFKTIQKLEPGHWLLATAGGVLTRQYWDLEYRTEASPWRSLDDAAAALGDLLRETVRDHMMSDVPVGFLASGGVDSTALLSYAVEQTDRPVETFTVGFSEAGVVDERPFARAASAQFGTTHHEITISADDFRDLLPTYAWHMEEPVCEPPAVALYCISRHARQYVKVLLSGEGGDEAFGGYPEYRNYPAFERMKRVAGPLRGTAGAALAAAGRMAASQRLRKYGILAGASLPDYYFSRTATPHDYFHRHRRYIYADDFARAVDGSEATEATGALFDRVPGTPLLNRMLYVDTKTWLPDDLLIKADKMTMAASLELRVPFLDHQVLEFAAALPVRFKVKGRETKRVLRRAFAGRVPQAILDRRKAGFPVPYEQWIGSTLRDFVRDTILDPAAVSRGYFQRDALERALGGKEQAAAPRNLFALVVLELWHRQFADRTDVMEPYGPRSAARAAEVAAPM